jgi:rod shape determining protein RodA
MSSIIPGPIARQPWSMLIPLTVLACFGAIVLYSAGGGSMDSYAQSHLIRFALFLTMALAIARVPRELVKLAAFPAYVGVTVLLVLVEALGAIGGGSQRWLDLGFIVLQPSEFMKPAIVLVLARFYDALPIGMTGSWRALIPAGALLAVPAGLVMLQPDLGTALAISFGAVVVMFLAGLPLLWFIGAGAAAMVVAPLAYFFLLHDYQRNRVLTFLDPESDPLGTGYHITQSKIAIGSGGLSGKGFGQGSQSHLNYLPEPHTDFVFATMAEEWGLIGGLLVLAMFFLILRWGTRVARRAPDRFSGLLASGMVATMFFYVAINLMMVMGLAPVVGIPLPFMSHGGSSMLTNMICIGTLMMVDRWSRRGRMAG